MHFVQSDIHNSRGILRHGECVSCYNKQKMIIDLTLLSFPWEKMEMEEAELVVRPFFRVCNMSYER